MPAEKQVTEAVQQALQRLLAHPCSLLLAVSGGIDSMVLLHVLRRVCTDKRWSLAVCHVHHGLRGVEADRDARFVEQETRRLHIAYVSKRLDVLAEQARTGESQEAVARRLRYQALVEAAASLGASVIATAHHQQDQAETVLLRVLRGTSVSGLAGIQESRQLGERHLLIRPLLQVTKEEIVAFAAQEQIAFVEDSTNASVAYTRNRVRHELLPLLQERFHPKVVSRLARLSALAAEDDRYLQTLARQALVQVARFHQGADCSVVLDVERLAELPLALQRRVITLVLDYAQPGVLWPFYRVEAVRKAALEPDHHMGASSLGYGWSVARRAGELHVFRLADSKESAGFVWPPLTVELADGICHRLGRSYVVCVEEKSTPSVFPASKWESYVSRGTELMTLRPWLQGDRIEPLGLGGHSKLVSDILVDAKVPREERATYPVFVVDGCVIWVPGLCRSRHDLVQPTDATCWRLSVGRDEHTALTRRRPQEE